MTRYHGVSKSPGQRLACVQSVHGLSGCACPSWHTLGTTGVRERRAIGRAPPADWRLLPANTQYPQTACQRRRITVLSVAAHVDEDRVVVVVRPLARLSGTEAELDTREVELAMGG